jgi:hypothetical protein
MDFDYSLAKDIILVSIPVVGAGITAVFATNRWQKRKERNEIKRRILSEFTESLARRYASTGEFIGIIHNKYLDYNSPVEKNGKLEFVIFFPENDDEKPFKKYKDVWEKFEDTYWELTYSENNFYRSVTFYYNDNEINAKISEVVDALEDAFGRSHIFFESRNLKDFREHYNYIYHKKSKIAGLLGELESLLIKKKIKII